MADDLGLTERDKELKKWNAPYRFQEYPKALYHGTTTTAGRIEVTTKEAHSSHDEAVLRGQGWVFTPSAAEDAARRAGEDLGTLAAERAYTDRRMSPAAQAEAAAVDATTAKHLPEIPEQPRRSHKKAAAE